MTTPTEPAARLTVRPDSIRPDALYYLLQCSHGGVGRVAEPRLGHYASTAFVVNQLVSEHLRFTNCHCADAIRARYGAGGEGEP